MRFKLIAPWAGPPYLETGTEIDLRDSKWDSLALPLPLCAQALDQDGLDHLCRAYGPDHLRLIQHAPRLTKPSVADYPLWLSAQREKDLA